MQGIDNFCVAFVLIPAQSAAQLSCLVTAPVLVFLEESGQRYWGVTAGKGTCCPLEKHSR